MPVLITDFPKMEKLVALVYSHDVFYLFQKVIKKSGKLKTAKEGFLVQSGMGCGNGYETNVHHYLSLVSSYIRMCRLANGSLTRYNELKEKLLLETNDLEAYFESIDTLGVDENHHKSPKNDGTLGNPVVVRTKGCGLVPKATPRKRKRVQTCSIRKGQGYNKSTFEARNNPFVNEDVEINGFLAKIIRLRV
ncbi:hypothetical protein RIF29_09523 [Crotalaria pallida]|uniref:Uncharacterized protein n=1 Tax=Crotalaria pallida TaxID=3830 RepID=A0AAN9IJH7_CROPI